MKTTTTALATAVLSFASCAPATAGEQAPEHRTQKESARDIVDTAVRAGSFDTLVAAVKAAGLVETLKSDGPFTVFAPTDEAFAALPEGTVAALLQPENLGQLKRILTFHVVPGRVLAGDLLPTGAAKTVSGDAVRFGLTVGGANVTQADIECSNGVIHVVDSVLLPPARKHADREGRMNVDKSIERAIEQGVPIYNAGDTDRCAAIYRDTARRLLGAADLADLHRVLLTDALTSPADDASAEAWAIRRAFDTVLSDNAFRPRIEAPLPEGFPGAGPVGRVVTKEYPQYRAARADGGRAFWKLFEHIKANDVAMTAPVEMTMDEDMRMRDMAFLYERPSQGESGTQGAVAVIDLKPLKVLSLGMRGRRTRAAVEQARKVIERRMAADGIRAKGPWRTLGYNSPMVPDSQKYWEVQVTID